MCCLFLGEKGKHINKFPQEISEKCRDSPRTVLGQSRETSVYVSPLPNISTLASLISPRKSPQNAENGVPKMKNSRNYLDRGFLWKFYIKPEIPGISRPIPISDFGVPIFSVLGGNEVDMLGSADLCVFLFVSFFFWP